MELDIWRPFGEPRPFRNEMDRFWNRFLGETPFARTFTGDWFPSVDISETKDELLIKAELPGLVAKDVNVSISGDLLTIKGESAQEKEEQEGKYHIRERRYGSMLRSINLHTEVDVEKAEAVFEKGVLKLTLPKTESVKSKRIEIKVK